MRFDGIDERDELAERCINPNDFSTTLRADEFVIVRCGGTACHEPAGTVRLEDDAARRPGSCREVNSEDTHQESVVDEALAWRTAEVPSGGQQRWLSVTRNPATVAMTN